MVEALKETAEKSGDLLKDFSGEVKKEIDKVKKKPPIKTIGLILVLIIAGVVTGNLLSSKFRASNAPTSRDVSSEEITAGTTVGVGDEKTFKDTAEGELTQGGLDGEGSHHLVRPGGETQYVYLTSSIVDLDKFVGRQVKVWGETFAGTKAGWLMDVGKIKVLE